MEPHQLSGMPHVQRNVAGVKQMVADQAAGGGPQLPPLPQAVRA